MQTGGQLISGQADLVLRTETGTVIIDHKTFTGDDAALTEKTLTFAQQLGWYRKIIESAGDWGEVSTYVNFICAGSLLAVKVQTV
jgi:ATP-dependent exoDNAse (exonuclease V) beta subunit